MLIIVIVLLLVIFITLISMENKLRLKLKNDERIIERLDVLINRTLEKKKES
ncbi:hypothetical protein N0M98_24760 [Paenibacillus doosanensis]|uniref:Uncharacterized protein n=1 Tax=Paenibacillus konkukensis TaxID=2020716 RepID=A0ABY4S3F7_9BACL|nr:MULTISPECIES: hypothetical protein [Paenibacillus]MCS7463338.1 hypothetical protein [Paenibacillus doosanensis]UQZ87644.1 hypothetical protein SK3146_06946 [Paenibacillus konkukensis]